MNTHVRPAPARKPLLNDFGKTSAHVPPPINLCDCPCGCRKHLQRREALNAQLARSNDELRRENDRLRAELDRLRRETGEGERAA